METSTCIEVLVVLMTIHGLQPVASLNICPQRTVMSNHIIDVNASRAAGAKFVGRVALLDLELCGDKCCDEPTCNVAVYRNEDNSNETPKCFLFNCLNPSVCEFVENGQFMVDVILKTSRPAITAPAPTTPPYLAPQRKVPLLRGCRFGYDECSDINADCTEAGFCLCKDTHRPKNGVCREQCIPELSYECINGDPKFVGPDCVAAYDVCDGILHCADGSDETNCPSAVKEGSAVAQVGSEKAKSGMAAASMGAQTFVDAGHVGYRKVPSPPQTAISNWPSGTRRTFMKPPAPGPSIMAGGDDHRFSPQNSRRFRLQPPGGRGSSMENARGSSVSDGAAFVDSEDAYGTSGTGRASAKYPSRLKQPSMLNRHHWPPGYAYTAADTYAEERYEDVHAPAPDYGDYLGDREEARQKIFPVVSAYKELDKEDVMGYYDNQLDSLSASNDSPSGNQRESGSNSAANQREPSLGGSISRDKPAASTPQGAAMSARLDELTGQDSGKSMVLAGSISSSVEIVAKTTTTSAPLPTTLRQASLPSQRRATEFGSGAVTPTSNQAAPGAAQQADLDTRRIQTNDDGGNSEAAMQSSAIAALTLGSLLTFLLIIYLARRFRGATHGLIHKVRAFGGTQESDYLINGMYL